ncbi:RES family NAD+ phosphorylase [Dyadobacter sp. CY312]|uniref:RES family NAD+ phosphorylase n=1 Tax=Dyadobacter sp. CY312 TaxID=2907303 RepID=UPI001F25CD91|nr:RES family NAD+ phosphorylase [Dyadobacter sp. CY312]MCE7044404.1 RES family NAD+ phosphorylase [Dyadobacter sp. CY312]
MPEHIFSDPAANNQTMAYRLVKERFIDTPLSSEGAKRYGGRWNPVGTGILYTSSSPELALLEQLVHLPALPYQDLPRLFLITMVFACTPKLVEKLSPNWRDPANYYDNHQLLENWLNDPDVMALKVPSAVVAESYNFLLHPLHREYSEIKILSTKAFNIDPRLWNVRNP